jgi:hypothetical protein
LEDVMATLSAADRKKLPAGKFAGPGRSFPIPDANHARFAIAMASRSRNAGNISAATASQVIAKARRKLGKSAAESLAK